MCQVLRIGETLTDERTRGLPWKGFYAVRRGMGTSIYMKSPQSAMKMLRHVRITTTQAFYVASIAADTLEAVTAFEADVKAARDKRETVKPFLSLTDGK